MKTKIITQTGIVVGGQALLRLWDDSTGTIEMEEYFLPYDKISKDNILRCVNDNCFGCRLIKEAAIDIYIKYNNGSLEYDRTVLADYEQAQPLFLGWKELREQGIKC